MTGCLLQLSATIRKIRIPSDNCDEQSDLLYTQSPHQVLKCGDLVFEHLVKQLEVVVVDDGEVFGDIDICNFVVDHLHELIQA